MNTTHIGKIGRLPKVLRDELGQRLEDGLPGTEIVQWLNSQPDAKSVLDRYFHGRAITEQNLSEWRQTGHLDWLRRQEAREAAFHLVEQAEDLDNATCQANLSHRFATVFAAEFTRLAMALLEPETDPEKKWQRLCQIHRELSRLRRDDDRASRVAIQQQRWERDAEQQDEEEFRRAKVDHKKEMLNRIIEAGNVKADTEYFGGGEVGRKWAERLYRIRCGLPMDPKPERAAPSEAKPAQPLPVSPAVNHACANPAKNPRIQANPT